MERALHLRDSLDVLARGASAPGWQAARDHVVRAINLRFPDLALFRALAGSRTDHTLMNVMTQAGREPFSMKRLNATFNPAVVDRLYLPRQRAALQEAAEEHGVSLIGTDYKGGDLVIDRDLSDQEALALQASINRRIGEVLREAGEEAQRLGLPIEGTSYEAFFTALNRAIAVGYPFVTLGASQVPAGAEYEDILHARAQARGAANLARLSPEAPAERFSSGTVDAAVSAYRKALEAAKGLAIEGKPLLVWDDTSGWVPNGELLDTARKGLLPTERNETEVFFQLLAVLNTLDFANYATLSDSRLIAPEQLRYAESLSSALERGERVDVQEVEQLLMSDSAWGSGAQANTPSATQFYERTTKFQDRVYLSLDIIGLGPQIQRSLARAMNRLLQPSQTRATPLVDEMLAANHEVFNFKMGVFGQTNELILRHAAKRLAELQVEQRRQPSLLIAQDMNELQEVLRRPIWVAGGDDAVFSIPACMVDLIPAIVHEMRRAMKVRVSVSRADGPNQHERAMDQAQAWLDWTKPIEPRLKALEDRAGANAISPEAADALSRTFLRRLYVNEAGELAVPAVESDRVRGVPVDNAIIEREFQRLEGLIPE